MSGQLPLGVPTKLVVLMAFDRDYEGNLLPAWDAREMQSADRAVRTAKDIAHLHAGVIAWNREASIALGDYDIAKNSVLFRVLPHSLCHGVLAGGLR